MEALARARRIASRIGLVTHASDVPVFSNFQQSFGTDIEHRRFVTREDARDCIADLRANGIEVIVGTGMAIDHAEQAGLPGVLLYSADSVRQAFEHALELTQALARSGGNHAAPRRRPAARADAPELLGDSEAMAQVRAQIALYAPHDSTVLVSGETGTGKELVARQLHAASGRRGRFVALNCGAISESLLEAELFGYSDGAFTGARRGGRVGLVEAADGGTLFWMKLVNYPCRCRPACCACWKNARCCVSVPPNRPRSTCAWWPPPCSRWSSARRPVVSVATSTTAGRAADCPALAAGEAFGHPAAGTPLLPPAAWHRRAIG